MAPVRDQVGACVQLSLEQSAVVIHRGSDFQVTPYAGSGKTESISRRIAVLIAEGTERTSIVAFTFMDRTAAEKERVVRRVGGPPGQSMVSQTTRSWSCC